MAAQATERYWTGFLSPLEFIDRYIPATYTTQPEPSLQGIKFPKCWNDERHEHAVEDFLQFIQASGLLSDGTRLHTMSQHTTTTLDTEPSPKVPSVLQNDNGVSFGWHRLGLFMEFTKYGDPFQDQPEVVAELGTIEKPERDSILTRGRLALYAREAFRHQHRIYLLQLLFFGDMARFIRWDRAGASVSAKFNYVDDPRPLERFLRLYGRPCDVRRGWDMTVSMASPHECTKFLNACKAWSSLLPPYAHIRSTWERNPATNIELALDSSWPTYKVSLQPYPLAGGVEDAVIIRRPFHTVDGPVVGPGTRQYLAYSTRWDMLVVFKDGWRYNDNLRLAEATALHTINKNKRNMSMEGPRVITSGDVVGNVTRTNELAIGVPGQGLGTKIKTVISQYPLHHHRLVQEVACAMECLPSLKDRIHVIRDCFHSVGVAAQSGIIHRNITRANIMARPLPGFTQWTGFLDNWDASTFERWRLSGEQGLGHVDLEERWKYLSISQLESPTKRHDILDDFEALFWILHEEFLDSMLDVPRNEPDFLTQRSYMEMKGQLQYVVAGRLKKQYLLGLRLQGDDVSAMSSPRAIFEAMAKHLQVYYKIKEEIPQMDRKEVWPAVNLAVRSLPIPRMSLATAAYSLPDTQFSVVQRFVLKYMQLRSPLFWLGLFAEVDRPDNWPSRALSPSDTSAPRGGSKKQDDGVAVDAMAKGIQCSLRTQRADLARIGSRADHAGVANGDGNSTAAGQAQAGDVDESAPGPSLVTSVSETQAWPRQASSSALSFVIRGDGGVPIEQSESARRQRVLQQRKKEKVRMRRL